jgi:hypothetical protein
VESRFGFKDSEGRGGVNGLKNRAVDLQLGIGIIKLMERELGL